MLWFEFKYVLRQKELINSKNIYKIIWYVRRPSMLVIYTIKLEKYWQNDVEVHVYVCVLFL